MPACPQCHGQQEQQEHAWPCRLHPAPAFQKDAPWGWVIVFASFMINLIADGITFSFGVIFVELQNEFHDSKASTAIVVGLFHAVPLLAGPIASVLTDYFGCRKMTILGSVLATLGFLGRTEPGIAGISRELSSVSYHLEVLYVTFGLVSGFGLSLCYVAAIVIVTHHFERKRSLATGISVAGSGIGTFVFAPLTQSLVDEYGGWRGATIVLAGILLNMAVCGALFQDRSAVAAARGRGGGGRRGGSRRGGRSRSGRRRGRARSIFSNLPKKKPAAVIASEEDQDKEEELNDLSANDSCSDRHLNTEVISYFDNSPGNGAATKGAAVPNDGEGEEEEKKSLMARNASPEHCPGEATILKPCKPEGSASLEPHRELGGGLFPHIDRFSCPDIAYSLGGSLSAAKKYSSMPIVAADAECAAVPDAAKPSPKPILFQYGFSLFCVSNLILYTWYDVMYLYLLDYAEKDLSMGDQATYLISVLGIFNTVGEVVLGYFGDQRCVNMRFLYAACMLVCGAATAVVPLFSAYWVLLALAGVFGFAISANYSLTSPLLVQLVSLEKFSHAYGTLLLAQGISNLAGPPFAGYLYDLTGVWYFTFGFAGLFIALSGLLLVLPWFK